MPRKLPLVVEGDKDPELDYEAVRAEEEALRASRLASALLPAPAPINVSTLETITGNLRAYAQLQPGTMLHVDELMHERRSNLALRDQTFYTADGALYFLQGRTPTLAITREKDNLVLRHLDDAFTQLTRTKNYRPDVQEAQQSIGAPETVLIDVTKLHLHGDDAEWRYLEISTTNYNKLRPEERKLVERVYGQGNEFSASMAMLKEAGIEETKVYVLNPAYVQKEAVQGPLGRASWLNFFTIVSNFGASDRDVGGSGRLRGVRRESVGEMPAGGAL